MSFIAIEFIFLEERDNDLEDKEPAVAESCSHKVTYIFKRPYIWEQVPMFNAKINDAINHGCNWNDGDVLYSELESLLHCEISSAVSIYCFGYKKQTLLTVLSTGQLQILLSLVALN
jgi:hypothetical protein